MWCPWDLGDVISSILWAPQGLLIPPETKFQCFAILKSEFQCFSIFKTQFQCFSISKTPYKTAASSVWIFTNRIFQNFSQHLVPRMDVLRVPHDLIRCFGNPNCTTCAPDYISASHPNMRKSSAKQQSFWSSFQTKYLRNILDISISGFVPQYGTDRIWQFFSQQLVPRIDVLRVSHALIRCFRNRNRTTCVSD